ncbi:replication factor C subunit 1-like [Macrobrachium nipponense]|uniref:replication factor C subunit 1-like n=1 Tax=Macrobrachium nipponense TaxID=159736 RepID=UPI0030C7EBE7
MDIRKYFSPVGGSKPNTTASSKETKKKNRIIDSDDEDPLPSSSKKQKILASDSDDDIFSSSKNKKSKAGAKTKKKSLPKPEPPKLKPAAVSEFFGSNPVVRKEAPVVTAKKKEVEMVEVHSDDDFEKTLQELDEKKNKEKSSSQHEKKDDFAKTLQELDEKKNKEKSSSQHEKKDDFAKTLQELDEKRNKEKYSSQHEKKEKSKDITPKKTKHESKSESHNEEKPKPNENSPPDENAKKSSLSSKLSAKINSFEKKDKLEVEKKERTREVTPHKEKKRDHRKEGSSSHEKKRKHSDDGRNNRRDRTPDKNDNIHKKQKLSTQKDEGFAKQEEKGAPKRERYESGEKEKCVEQRDVTPSKQKNEKEKSSSMKEKPKGITPKKEEIASDIETTPQPDEKKKIARAAYFKFLQRSGPSNPGSKPIPEGKPECLQGLVFVLTGVLESLDREEASELIKKYGGKVTSSLSRNTTYVIVGNEAGESKLKKAEQLGTKQITEDDLLDLIRTRPGKGSNETPKGNEKKSTASKLKAFERSNKASIPTKNSGSDEAASDLPPVNFSSSKSTKSSPQKSFTLSQSSQDSQKIMNGNSQSSSTSSPKTQPVSSQELKDRSGETLMWVDKYKPVNVKNIIGQQGDKSNVKKLSVWLQNWKKNQFGGKKLVRPSPWAKDDNGAFFKCALLSGPPGVGKTTTAHLVCKEAGFDFVELNASDARSKRRLDEVVAELLSNKNLAGYAGGKEKGSTSENHALVMDEVDGMSGNEDRGGVQELISLIKKSKVPIIAMCNDRNHPKIRSLANYCFDLRFNKPRIEQIRGPMMSVCFREGVKIKPDALDQIIMGANQDVRQILHHLSVWSANRETLAADAMKVEAEKAKKDLKLGPWDVCKKVFTESDHKNMSIYDKSDLFFHDYSIAPLFVQENYPKCVPHSAQSNRRKTLEQLSKTAASIADGDLCEKAIRSRNAWSLLPVQAMYSSVLPGDYMSGHLSSQIEFPKWLGNNSRRNKFDRLMQELQMHMRLRISGSKMDVNMDYCESLKNAVTQPLVKEGVDGIHSAMDVMNTYNLLREDLDSMLELTQWPGSKDPMSNVDSKVKAAFTRTYNKEGHMTPFAHVTVTKKKKGSSGGMGEEGMYGEDEEESEEEEEDITKSAMIMVKKGGGKKGEPSSSKGEGRGGSSNRGAGRGRGRGGRGRGKK